MTWTTVGCAPLHISGLENAVIPEKKPLAHRVGSRVVQVCHCESPLKNSKERKLGSSWVGAPEEGAPSRHTAHVNGRIDHVNWSDHCWILTWCRLDGRWDECSNERERCHLGELQMGKCSTFIFATSATSLTEVQKHHRIMQKNLDENQDWELKCIFKWRDDTGNDLLFVQFYQYFVDWSNKLNKAVYFHSKYIEFPTSFYTKCHNQTCVIYSEVAALSSSAR